jgi:cation transport regulator ChaC
VHWVFAYGSLLPAGHAVLPDGAVAANLLGWRRSWSVAMDNSVDLPGYKHYVAPDGDRPDLMVCYLDIAEREGAAVNGVALRVGAEELPALDERERNYERREVTGHLDVRLGGRIWAYIGGRAGRARARRGRRERRLAVASTSASWPASTCCASAGASRRSPRPRACRWRSWRSSTTLRWPCRAVPADRA